VAGSQEHQDLWKPRMLLVSITSSKEEPAAAYNILGAVLLFRRFLIGARDL